MALPVHTTVDKQTTLFSNTFDTDVYKWWVADLNGETNHFHWKTELTSCLRSTAHVRVGDSRMSTDVMLADTHTQSHTLGSLEIIHSQSQWLAQTGYTHLHFYTVIPVCAHLCISFGLRMRTETRSRHQIHFLFVQCCSCWPGARTSKRPPTFSYFLL